MIDERLSAFLDGECDADESESCIRRLSGEPPAREAWQRQLWVREALRGRDALPALDADFADRVQAALGELPVTDRAKVVALPARRRRWLGRAAGLAAAASVAAVVVVATDPLSPTAAPPATTIAAGAPSPARDEATGSLASAVADRDAEPADHWSVSDPAVEDQLNGYLIEHNGLARRYGLSGATPSFVRVATYGQGGAR